ncbi:MAG: DUF2118 domain-containing protein [Sulfolobales archaeon]
MIEEECEKARDSNYCYCLVNNEITRSCERCEKCFLEYPYEDAYKYIIDLENQLIKKSFIITPPGSPEALYIPKNTKVNIIEISGVSVSLLVKEGDEIKRGDRVARILTSKGEIRSYKINTEGIVLYVTDLFGGSSERILILIGSKNSLGRVRIGF